MTDIKLTSAQKEVIANMRDGVPYYFAPFRSSLQCTQGQFGIHAKIVSEKLMSNLYHMELVEQIKYNGEMNIFTLTELGKTIKI